MKFLTKLINRYLRNRFRCGYCNKVLAITWKWQKPKDLKCDCPEMKKAAYKARKEYIKIEAQKLKKKLEGSLLTKTANYCLVCGFEILRAPGQIAWYDCKVCRKRGRGGKRNRRILKKLKERGLI